MCGRQAGSERQQKTAPQHQRHPRALWEQRAACKADSATAALAKAAICQPDWIQTTHSCSYRGMQYGPADT